PKVAPGRARALAARERTELEITRRENVPDFTHLENLRLCLMHNHAAHSVCSPPQPNPGLPGFGRFKICRKRASPQPAGEGLGVGVHRRTTPAPHPARFARDPPHMGEGKDRVCRAFIPLHTIAFGMTRLLFTTPPRSTWRRPARRRCIRWRCLA